jgi:hypothetical protein
MARMWRYAPLLLGVGLVALFFYQLAFTNLILARGDTFTFFYPYWNVRNAYFRLGELPLWTPDLFMGSPLLAEPQLGTFYPPNWLTTPFDAPNAIRYSLLGHVLWAFMGMFILFNYVFPQPRLNMGAIVAGVAFACGGYVGAHVEQINQLQGIAWMPWLFWLFAHVIKTQPARRRAEWLLWLAIALALQFLSGHTQTVFISAVGLGLFALLAPIAHNTWQARLQRIVLRVGMLLLVAVVMVLLVLPQFIPTLELTGMSNRGGSGFNRDQATAFSLPPHYIGRSLLPSYDGLLFTEYLGTLGVIGLGLALLASVYRYSDAPTSRWRWVFLGIALMGLFLAIGRYNPVYYELLARLTGFNLFRVPSRWLALWALGMAFLAGMGVQIVSSQRVTSWRLFVPLGVLASLIMVTRLLPNIAPMLAIVPEDFTGNAIPSETTLLGWGVALAILAIVMFRRITQWLIVGSIIAELWFASLVMPHHDLVPHDVYTSQRLTISQMQAYRTQAQPMARVLAISGLLFDVGDKNTLRARYEQLGMSADAIQIAFTALKRQEMLMSNLPLTWGIASVDGYGGGLLPTMAYSQFTSLLLPDGTLRTTDGRLGEILARDECQGACVPLATWLDMMNVGYVIRDKLDEIAPSNTPSVPSEWQKVLSSDIKIFRLPASSRVTWAQNVMPFADTWQGSEEALVALRADPTITAIHGIDAPLTVTQDSPAPVITHYTATQMTIQVQATQAGYIVIRDAWYPHWQAMVNGQATPVYRANVLFRAVRVPTGTSEVVLTFEPTIWQSAMLLGAQVWVIVLALLVWLGYRRRMD